MGRLRSCGGRSVLGSPGRIGIRCRCRQTARTLRLPPACVDALLPPVSVDAGVVLRRYRGDGAHFVQGRRVLLCQVRSRLADSADAASPTGLRGRVPHRCDFSTNCVRRWFVRRRADSAHGHATRRSTDESRGRALRALCRDVSLRPCVPALPDASVLLRPCTRGGDSAHRRWRCMQCVWKGAAYAYGRVQRIWLGVCARCLRGPGGLRRPRGQGSFTFPWVAHAAGIPPTGGSSSDVTCLSRTVYSVFIPSEVGPPVLAIWLAASTFWRATALPRPGLGAGAPWIGGARCLTVPPESG